MKGLFAVFVCLVAALIPSTGSAGSGAGRGIARPAAAAAFSQRVLDLVNEERAEAGLAPLRNNNLLSDAAQFMANDMSTSGQFSHVDSRGRSVGSRMTEHGYSWRNAAENIAMGQQSPEEVVQGWLNSPGHRRNLLNASYADLGFGLARSSRGHYIWVQVFGRAR
jgi:uncharacterized protein YkwD